MRTFSILAIALLATVAVCQVVPATTRCPQNVQTAIEEVRQALANRSSPLSQKFILIEKLAILGKECVDDLKDLFAPKTLGAPANPTLCKTWEAELKSLMVQMGTGRFPDSALLAKREDAREKVRKYC